MKNFKIIFIIMGILLLSTACYKKAKETEGLCYIKKLYEKDEKYFVYESDLIDTYIIASGIINGNKVNNQKNYDNKLYSDAIEYFKEYREHDFIKYIINNSDKYCDLNNNTFNLETIADITEYLFYKNNLFDLGVKEIENKYFIDMLIDFYKETDAGKYFAKKHINKYDQSKFFFQTNIITGEFISEMETYIGNKKKSFADKKVLYVSIFTLYAPQNAFKSFIQNEEQIILIANQSLVGKDFNSDNLDYTQSLRTTIHEFLHFYINDAVFSNVQVIEKKANGFDKKEFGGIGIYHDMSWNRLVDENIVRAINARIFNTYSLNYKDKYDEIINDEISYGGFSKLESLIEKMKDYEHNREEFANIEEFIPELIDELFSHN